MQKLKSLSTPLAMIGLLACGIFATVYGDMQNRKLPDDCVAIIYTFEDPAEVLAGKSSCIPCNNLVRDLNAKFKYADGGKGVVGTSPQHVFQLRKAPSTVKKTPLVVYYYSDGSKDYLQGYDGSSLREFALKHSCFAGKGGNRHAEYQAASRQSRLQYVSLQADGYRPRGDQPNDSNTTPFKTEQLRSLEVSPTIPELPLDRQEQVAQLGFYTPFGGFGFTPPPTYYAPRAYSQSCATSSSYYAPSYRVYSSSCNGGGLTPPPGGGGGGGDFYTPSFAPQYRTYSSGQFICGPDGCYRIP